jgi:hypothetical protein
MKSIRKIIMSSRFVDKEEIIKLIDFYRAEANLLLKDAADDDVLADHLRDTKESYRIERIRDDASGKRKRAAWRDARIKSLGEKLSEIQTPELPGHETDGSIPKS